MLAIIKIHKNYPKSFQQLCEYSLVNIITHAGENLRPYRRPLLAPCSQLSVSNEKPEVAKSNPIKVRVMFEMPWTTHDWPGKNMLNLLAKNESQDKTILSKKYGYRNRACMDDYQPLNVYVYLEKNGDINRGTHFWAMGISRT